MERIYTKLALYGSRNECARTDTVFLPISEVCNGTVSLTKTKVNDSRRDSTLVEVETGPHFSGLLAAETMEAVPGCHLSGIKASPKSSYSLLLQVANVL